MSDEASRPRSIPDPGQQCGSTSPRDSHLYACSQPDRSGLNDNWLVRDLSRSVVSLSFRNLYLDDERTIILQQDVKDKDRKPHDIATNEAVQNHPRESIKYECDAGDYHRSPVSDDLLTTEPPLSDLADLSTQYLASQEETKEFYAKEMSEYVMIGSSSNDSEEKINGGSEMCDSNYKQIDDACSSSSIHELSRSNTDSPRVRSRASISNMNTSSTSSINDLDISQRSSLNASMNSYASQSSSATGIIINDYAIGQI